MKPKGVKWISQLFNWSKLVNWSTEEKDEPKGVEWTRLYPEWFGLTDSYNGSAGKMIIRMYLANTDHH